MTDIQRPNYFTSQFLVEEDFNDEQAYHRDMRLRHNRSLYSWGVVEGLEVTQAGDKKVTVSEGMAIDKDGREIIILPDSEANTINFDGLALNTTLEIAIIYHEIKDKPYRIGDETKYTRITERPKFIIYGGQQSQNIDNDHLEVRIGSAPTDGDVILLARVTLDNNGNVSNVEDSVRKLAGNQSSSTGKWIDGDDDNSIYYNDGNVGIGTENPSEKLEVDGTVKAKSLITTGMIRGSSMPPNLIRNSYMNILDGDKPAGYISGGKVTLEAAHPFTKGFEGIHVAEKPANAADSVDDATEENPYWFGKHNKGARIKRGGLADGWITFPDGKILKITGDNSGKHTRIFFPFESQGNFFTKKVHLKAWLKISSGKQVGFGQAAGSNNQQPNNGLIITKEQSDNAPDGWYRVDGVISTSEVTRLGGQSFSMGITGDEADGSFEVYLALPYLANLDYDTWLPSVSDMFSRNGLTVHPTSGNVGIGTTNPSKKLEVNGTVKATMFEGDGSLLKNISSGGQWKPFRKSNNLIGYNGGVLVGNKIPSVTNNFQESGLSSASFAITVTNNVATEFYRESYGVRGHFGGLPAVKVPDEKNPDEVILQPELPNTIDDALEDKITTPVGITPANSTESVAPRDFVEESTEPPVETVDKIEGPRTDESIDPIKEEKAPDSTERLRSSEIGYGGYFTAENNGASIVYGVYGEVNAPKSRAEVSTSYGVYGKVTGAGYAGYFDGKVYVTGDLEVAGTVKAKNFEGAGIGSGGNWTTFKDNSNYIYYRGSMLVGNSLSIPKNNDSKATGLRGASFAITETVNNVTKSYGVRGHFGGLPAVKVPDEKNPDEVILQPELPNTIDDALEDKITTPVGITPANSTESVAPRDFVEESTEPPVETVDKIESPRTDESIDPIKEEKSPQSIERVSSSEIGYGGYFTAENNGASIVYGVYGEVNAPKLTTQQSQSYGVYGKVTGAGYAGYFQGNAHVTGNLTTDNNVGIGTTTPSKKLVVTGGETSLQQEDWQNPQLQNGWANYGIRDYNDAGYFKDSLGIVHLKGLVKDGKANLIFQLPPGYTPANRELHGVATSDNVMGRVDIFPNGRVERIAGSSNWISLDGITFRAVESSSRPVVVTPPIITVGS